MSKPPRIVALQTGAMVEVTDQLVTGARNPHEVERLIRESLYRQGRRPMFRYRGRWPYRAFGKPVLQSHRDKWRQTTVITAKWSRAVALWRKP